MFASDSPDSSPQASSQTQATIQSDSVTISDEQAARRRRLEECVSEFRDGRRSRVETYAEMLRELDHGPELSQEEKDTTFGLFSAEIESAEARTHHHQALVGPRTKAVAPQPARSVVQRDESDSGSEGGEERSTKKPKLHESDMPWFSRAVDGPGTNPYTDKTIRLLRTFNKDVKRSKFYVSISPGAPDNIPASQWEHIFKGEPIDLDQILSSLYRVTVVEERKARIGETDIALGPVEAARKVSTSSDWSTAWRRAARATAFAFPHRARELEDYAEYIENEFAAKNSTGHHRIILYDVAVRNLVRGGQQILLTDIHCFVSLYSAIVLPDEIQYGGQKGQARPMDSLACFGEKLMALRRSRPELSQSDSYVIWKSDISEAYRVCPLHPFWQLKQGVQVGTDVHVDRCIVFGSSASPAIFIAFNSLVSWIAERRRDISFITTYLDDSSGCTTKDDLTFYVPYQKHLPSPQARLLSLWDDLGIPHEE